MILYLLVIKSPNHPLGCVKEEVKKRRRTIVIFFDKKGVASALIKKRIGDKAKEKYGTRARAKLISGAKTTH